MICQGKIAVTKKLAQRFQRDDFFAHKRPGNPDIIWLSVKNRSGGRWAQRIQRVTREDFFGAPGGAFASKPASFRESGQTRF
jgi:hypothetical protein